MAQCRAYTTPMDDHCCWLRGMECPYARQLVGGTWECTLRSELGSWEAVHEDPRYLRDVKPEIDTMGLVENCGDWPGPGQVCATCGAGGE